MPFTRMALALALATIPVAAGAALFARHAVTVSDIYGSPRPKTIEAPDGRTRAIARYTDWASDGGDRLTVFLGGDDHEFAGGPDAELLWAPDSRALAVTADDSGVAQRFGLSVLVRKPTGRHWRQIELADTVTQLFAPHMRCDDDDETPDIGAVGWTGPHRLIVAARVPPRSGCARPGTIAAYIVDAPSGEVLMDFPLTALRRFHHAKLGTIFARHRHARRR